MKKLISITVAFVLVFLTCVPAFSADKNISENCENIPVVIVRGMDFGGLYVDYGTENEQPAINTDAWMIVKGVLKAIGSGIITMSFDSVIDGVADLACNIFGNFTMDENGDSLYNVSTPKYPESADKYENLKIGTDFEYGMVRACIETFGEGHTYYVNYDWRLDPFVVADDINAAVESAIKNTGHDKVNIVCCSMGGLMTVAYLTEYGYEKVNRCLFMSSTFCGAQVASDLLTGKVDITAKNLYNMLGNSVKDNKILSFVVDKIYDLGLFGFITKITDFILDNYKDDVYQNAIIPVFGRIPSLWGLVQPEDYETAVKYIFGGRTEKNAAFLNRTDKIQNMMNGRTDLINEMIDSGVEIAVVAHYDTPVVPVYENAHFNGDGTLETYQMSGYATVAPYGETLGDDYIAKTSEYLSPDRVVDLSTALFPEYTYIIKGAPHVAGSYGTDYSDFFIWLLIYDGEFYAGASEKYPQFMVSDSSQTLSEF
ncbi:MAG: hypothetical protein E7547_01440 [Ruminococcaceae bacterium]|nr:hypothetical protein [Oscillospiraceae bacterium]